MDFYIRRYFWVWLLLTIILCAYFAARGANGLIAATLPAPKHRMVSKPRELPRHASLLGRTEQNRLIAERNIFCATCAPPPETLSSAEDEPKDLSDQPPVKTSLNIKLLATLVGDPDPTWSFAVVLDAGEGQTGMYAIGGKVAGQATIVDIHDRRLYLQNNGRNEYLDMEIPGGPQEPVSTPARRPPGGDPVAEELRQGVRQVGENKWEIQRSSLERVLSDTTLLARSARIVPSVQDGKPNGFKLYAIQPGSMYDLIGLRNGDTVHEINGRPITTPDQALQVYTNVRHASHLAISFSRQGKTVAHDYTIR